jgi:hypothetical protein
MFGKGLFLGIVILIGIPIPLRRRIAINKLDFSETTTLNFYVLSIFFFQKKERKKELGAIIMYSLEITLFDNLFIRDNIEQENS